MPSDDLLGNLPIPYKLPSNYTYSYTYYSNYILEMPIILCCCSLLLQVSSDDLLGVGLALCRLAEQLVAPAAAKGAAEAFRAFDTDGSGYLDFGERAHQQRRAPSVHELHAAAVDNGACAGCLRCFSNRISLLSPSLSLVQASCARRFARCRGCR